MRYLSFSIVLAILAAAGCANHSPSGESTNSKPVPDQIQVASILINTLAFTVAPVFAADSAPATTTTTVPDPTSIAESTTATDPVSTVDSTLVTAPASAADSTSATDPAPEADPQTPLISDDLPDNSNTLVETPSTDDFWQELRDQFHLEYSGASDPEFIRIRKSYVNASYFKRLSSRAYWFMPYIFDQIKKRGMPAEIALIPAIESAYRADTASHSKAAGLWQIIPSTARHFDVRQDTWMDGRRDLVQSTRAALDYLEYLADQFNHDWEHVFAAYNAGQGKMLREIRSNQKAGKPTGLTHLNLPRETREYVPRLFALVDIIRAPENYGIKLEPVPNRQTLAIIDVRTQTDLGVAASLISVSEDRLRFFNKGYKLGVTHPRGPHTIILPIEMADQLLTELNKLSNLQKLSWARHDVKEGEYLGLIANKYHVTVASLMRANQLSSNLLQIGQILRIPLSVSHSHDAKKLPGSIYIKDGYVLYTIRAGDSLWKIARKSNVSIAQILSWNDMLEHDLLHPGQQIIIGLAS